MRVAIIADSHFDECSRFDECVRVHNWIADDMRERRVDLVLHAGDVYERKSTPVERAAVSAWVQLVADFAPLVIVRGNHDAPRDLELLAKLDSCFPVIVEERAGVHMVEPWREYPARRVAVGCLAWPTKSSVLALSKDRVLSHAEGELIAGDALRAVLRGLGQQMHEHVGPKILLAHAMVRGSKVSTGQPLVGCDLEVGLEDLDLAGADFVAIGHIHMPQGWYAPQHHPLESAGASVVYPGSPRRTAFGEVEQKGYVIVDFDERGGATYERIPTPCAPMVLLEAAWCGDIFEGGRLLTEAEREGAEVRFRYTVPADDRVAAAAAAERVKAELLELGAVDVKLEERVLPHSTARAPEVASAPTLADKLAVLWRARNTTPEPERALELVDKASLLEAEEHAA